MRNATAIASITGIVFLAAISIGSPAFAAAASKRSHSGAAGLDSSAIDDAAKQPALAQGGKNAHVVRAQILLDRAWFSTGEIDGVFGSNMHKAVLGFQKAHELRPTGRVDAETWNALSGETTSVLTTYTVTGQDAAGPFARIPADMMERAQLQRLPYESLLEALAERFHAAPALLRKLNPGKTLEAGAEITVPDVLVKRSSAKIASLVIAKGDRRLTALDSGNRVVAQFPISLGGPHDPIPVGKLKVVTEVRDPTFTYDPDLLRGAKQHYRKVDIAPGPNNPVGVIWMGLSKPHYGIHGTPEPSRVGHEETNGCVHLTNWDALKLSEIASAGVVVDVRE
ncbi:MAG: L,D-transpeptidase [Casimicrobiaceae bacterium]